MCVHIYVCVYACAVMAQWEADDECFRLENWFAPEFTFNLWWVWPVVGSRGGTEKRILKTVLGFIQGKHAKKPLKWTWFEYFWGITLYELLQKSKQARLHWLHCEWCLLGLQQSKIKKQTKTSNVCPVSLDSKYWQMHHCRRKRVNVLTRCMWSGKKDQLNNNQIGCLISLADQNHATKSHDSWFLLSTESNSNLIDLLCLWLWKKKNNSHLFNILLSGLLQPKKKCVIHPLCLPFTVCSFPLRPIGSSSKITRMFCSASCYNLLPVGWPCYTAADSGRVWCICRTRCWSGAALWWADVSFGLIILWETDALASCSLQAVVSYRNPKWKKKGVIVSFTMERSLFEQLL